MRQSECWPHSDYCVPPPSPLATLAPQLYCLGIRLAETALAVPFVVAGSVLAAAKPWYCYGDPCREGWCDRCRCCEHKCRCGREAHHRGTADIRIHARAGDVRQKAILVQNNGPKPVTVTMAADPWTDCSEKTSANAASTITFTPATLTIEPCEARETMAQISVKAPLEAGGTYFTRVHMQGTHAKPILIELCVEPQNRIDYCAHTDPCRRRHDKYVDVCCEPCGEDPCCCGKCRPHYDDSCKPYHYDPCKPYHCDPCKPWSGACDPWWWQCDPWRWTGPDPRRLWYGPGHWERFWVASGKPCC